MKSLTLTSSACALALAAACAQRAPAPAAPPSPPSPSSHVTPAASQAPVEPAPIVLGVVIDQLPSWALDRYLLELSEDGLIRRAARDGAYHSHVRLPYAGTYTAAGHAAIATGGVPADTRIWSNYIYDRTRKKKVAIVDDGKHPVLGDAAAFASPTMLHADTVGDALHEATGGRAVVASLSQKGRAAIFLGGHHPDLALWYDKRIPGYTTSTYYAKALPSWLVGWEHDHLLESILEVWKPLHAEHYQTLLGPDAAPGEGDLEGYGSAFPHSPKNTKAPFDIARASPHATPRLLGLANEAAARLQMGTDEVPDLLWVSVSAVDYVGHIFGPESWEYLDALIRADEALGEFVDRLAERAPLRVLVTSDHGASRLPEKNRAAGLKAGRLFPDKAIEAVQQTAETILGKGSTPWVEAFVPPFVYLSDAARQSPKRDLLTEKLIARLEAMEEVFGAYDVREAAEWRGSENPFRSAVANSVDADAPGEIFVVPAEHYVFDEGFPTGYGTSHGTPWDYDREVPVLLWGNGITRASSTEPLEQRRVAATIAALLGIEPPPLARAAPLPGAPPAP